MRNLLRTYALRSNPYWPFTRLNRWPYDIALDTLVRVVRTSPEIRSVYVRAPREQPWIPGLTDIDLTLILLKKAE